MTKEDILKAITELPKEENKQVLSSMNAINVDELMNAIDRFNKVPAYNDLLKENNKLNDAIQTYDILLKANIEENKQLKDTWKNLKQIIKKKFVGQGGFTSYEWNDLLNDLLNKMQELEKRSHEYDERVAEQHCDFVDKHYTQKKEFIKYLEANISACENVSDLLFSHNKELKVYREVLQKYNEIIGN